MSEYLRLKFRSLIYTPSYEDMQAKVTINRRGLVTSSDFIADCELAWESYLEPRGLTNRFMNTFVAEERDMLSKGEILLAEIYIGEEFKRRKIHPVKYYFRGEQ